MERDDTVVELEVEKSSTAVLVLDELLLDEDDCELVLICSVLALLQLLETVVELVLSSAVL